ncbi:MAG: ATP-binding protein [Oscillospiraceae bacterium]|nr:ATP-binding protein [Oscillospiraceae bacterium]
MGSYLNPSSEQFKKSLRDEIYVDKSNLIAQTNAVFGTRRGYVCLSRPRRFGKSMAADMLAAYYGRGEDTSALFTGLKIGNDPSYQDHLNRHDVIKINMQSFLSKYRNIDEMLASLQKRIIAELRISYPCISENEIHLDWAMEAAFASTHTSFVVIIDEWDCIFREHKGDEASQNQYLDFLRTWLKDQAYVGLAYMTGILPIKKYGTHSALNMFDEYSMVFPGELAEFFGFTESEVRDLCIRYKMPYEEAKAWYDGYSMIRPNTEGTVALSMYNPNSVVRAMLRKQFAPYWNNTETYEALKIYIAMGFGGKMKEAVIRMLSGSSVPLDVSGFQNDMTSFNELDDALTLLVHLGYLTYAEAGNANYSQGFVSIPNKEVSAEYITSLKRTDGWSEVIRSVEASRKLLQSLWNMDETAVAEGIDRAHESVSILQYNDENALSYTIGLAFYSAIEYYTIIRELPAGKGYADVAYIPRKLYADKPAVVIELKYDKNAEGAIAQIKAKRYPSALSEYHGNLLLCGINYDRENKTHQCRIERLACIPSR